MLSITRNVSACNPATNTYSLSGQMEFSNPPTAGTLTISVGSKITVIIEGEDIKSPDDLKALAEQVDMSLLEKSF